MMCFSLRAPEFINYPIFHLRVTWDSSGTSDFPCACLVSSIQVRWIHQRLGDPNATRPISLDLGSLLLPCPPLSLLRLFPGIPRTLIAIVFMYDLFYPVWMMTSMIADRGVGDVTVTDIISMERLGGFQNSFHLLWLLIW